MVTWFFSDPHFEHLITTRPFASVEEQNDHLLKQINCRVVENDRLFCLGDFAARGVESWVGRIVCKNKHLIYGNHDKNSAGRYFKTAEAVTEIKIGEHKVWLSHYAHAYWPASHYGSFHLYGHNHAQREATLDAIWPDRRSMDVGVDNIHRLLGEFRPISDIEVLSLLGNRIGHDPVEFYRQFGTYNKYP